MKSHICIKSILSIILILNLHNRIIFVKINIPKLQSAIFGKSYKRSWIKRTPLNIYHLFRILYTFVVCQRLSRTLWPNSHCPIGRTCYKNIWVIRIAFQLINTCRMSLIRLQISFLISKWAFVYIWIICRHIINIRIFFAKIQIKSLNLFKIDILILLTLFFIIKDLVQKLNLFSFKRLSNAPFNDSRVRWYWYQSLILIFIMIFVKPN